MYSNRKSGVLPRTKTLKIYNIALLGTIFFIFHIRSVIMYALIFNILSAEDLMQVGISELQLLA